MAANCHYCCKVVCDEARWESVSKVEWFQDQESFCYDVVLFYKRVFICKCWCYAAGVDEAYCFNESLWEWVAQ